MRRGDEHAPVAIEREERERAEDVEVRFDPPAAEVDEQRAVSTCAACRWRGASAAVPLAVMIR